MDRRDFVKVTGSSLALPLIGEPLLGKESVPRYVTEMLGSIRRMFLHDTSVIYLNYLDEGCDDPSDMLKAFSYLIDSGYLAPKIPSSQVADAYLNNKSFTIVDKGYIGNIPSEDQIDEAVLAYIKEHPNSPYSSFLNKHLHEIFPDVKYFNEEKIKASLWLRGKLKKTNGTYSIT